MDGTFRERSQRKYHLRWKENLVVAQPWVTMFFMIAMELSFGSVPNPLF